MNNPPPSRHTGALAEADGAVAGQATFFSQAGIDGLAVQESLARARPAILGSGHIAAHARATLERSGLHDLRTLDEAALSPAGLTGLDCVLACLDAPHPGLLETLNLAGLEAGIPWITGQIDNGRGRMGPTVIPGQSPCYRCYEARRIANLDIAVDPSPAGAADGFVAPFAFAPIMGGFLALEAMRLLTGLAPPQTVGRLALLDFHAGQITYHRILRLPNCPACGYGKRPQAAAMLGG